MTIQLRIQNVDAVASFVGELPAKLEKRVLLDMSQVAYDAMQQGADKHTKTGALFQSVYNRAIPKGREVGHDPARTRTDFAGGMSYSVFVNFGTRPHIIRPKNKKALRWAAGNGFAFAKLVRHPGYIGDNYTERAAQEAVRQFDRIVTEALQEQA